jgi:hypothetical protein
MIAMQYESSHALPRNVLPVGFIRGVNQWQLKEPEPKNSFKHYLELWRLTVKQYSFISNS